VAARPDFTGRGPCVPTCLRRRITRAGVAPWCGMTDALALLAGGQWGEGRGAEEECQCMQARLHRAARQGLPRTTTTTTGVSNNNAKLCRGYCGACRLMSFTQRSRQQP
jgi:hypothetical protein